MASLLLTCFLARWKLKQYLILLQLLQLLCDASKRMLCFTVRFQHFTISHWFALILLDYQRYLTWISLSIFIYWQSQNARHHKYDWTKEGQRLHSCKMLDGYLSHCPSLTSIAPRVIHRSLKSGPDITFILSDVEVGIKPILTPRLVEDTSSLHLLQLTK